VNGEKSLGENKWNEHVCDGEYIIADAPGVGSMRYCVWGKKLFLCFGKKLGSKTQTEFQNVSPIHIFGVIAHTVVLTKCVSAVLDFNVVTSPTFQ
jgi:hypothetical protein